MTYVSTVPNFGALWKKPFKNVKHIIVIWCVLTCPRYQIYWIFAVTTCSKDSVLLNTLMETYNNQISNLCFLLIKYYLAVSSCLLHSILSMPQFHMSTVTKYGAQCLRFKQFLTADKQVSFLSFVQYNDIKMYVVNLQVVICR